MSESDIWAAPWRLPDGYAVQRDADGRAFICELPKIMEQDVRTHPWPKNTSFTFPLAPPECSGEGCVLCAAGWEIV